MRATIHNYLEAAKARREEEGTDKGFSLIELIIVVVILGILVAVAVPLVGALQHNAEVAAAEAAAANVATEIAADIAGGATGAMPTTGPAVAKYNLTGTVTTLDALCVTATSKKDATAIGKSGPGC